MTLPVATPDVDMPPTSTGCASHADGSTLRGRSIWPWLALVALLSGCVPQDLFKAWRQTDDLEERAASGDAESQYRLGMRYTNGRGVLRNDALAVDWFRKAARAGHGDAQFMLGAAYSTGRGVERDHAKAAEWYLQSAQTGHARAQFQLADAYVSGRGVERDRYWGARWYGMAAYQGHAEAQFILGALYSGGLGLPQSWFHAVVWLKRAELSGHPRATIALDTAESRMPESAFRDALNRAPRWRRAANLTGYANRPTLVYIQHALNRLGYASGFPDGLRGPKTERAMARYRQARGMRDTRSLARIVQELRQQTPALE